MCDEKIVVDNVSLNNNIQDELKQKREKALIEVLLRQTDISENEARELLIENNYDLMKSIRQYMSKDKLNTQNIETNKTKSKTINQMIYSEIRQTMDNASLNFLRKQEYQRKLETYRNRLLEEARQRYISQTQSQNEENNMNQLD